MSPCVLRSTMSDLLQNAAAALPLFMPRRNVTYRQGGVAISISATPGRSIVMYEGDDGMRIKIEMRNYLIQVNELVIGGAKITPNEGDTITDDNEGSTITYVVASDGGMSWRWSSRYHKQYRVIVKERSEMIA